MAAAYWLLLVAGCGLLLAAGHWLQATASCYWLQAAADHELPNAGCGLLLVLLVLLVFLVTSDYCPGHFPLWMKCLEQESFGVAAAVSSAAAVRAAAAAASVAQWRRRRRRKDGAGDAETAREVKRGGETWR